MVTLMKYFNLLRILKVFFAIKDVCRSFITCRLEDLNFMGLLFAWECGNFAHNNISERLDRSVANSTW